MILQSLVRYYERMGALASAEGTEGLAPVGFELKAIPFVIVLDPSGSVVTLAETKVDDAKGKRKIGKSELVPAGIKKTSGVAANLLWDTAEYVLGLVTEIKNKTAKPERICEQHTAFRQRIEDLPDTVKKDIGVAAVLRFLASPESLAFLERLPAWEELRTTNPLMSFRLQNDQELVCQRAAVREWWAAQNNSETADGFCLITGKPAVIERLHPSIRGVWGAQSSGASLVSFNLDAFTHYGREQGANASIGKDTAAMYTTALNTLLRDERHFIRVGDASTVFWADEPDHPIVSAFQTLFGAEKKVAKDDPARNVAMVKQVFDSVRSGSLAADRSDTRFNVLGLSPNAARLSVRFWHTATVAELSPRFQAHLEALEVVRPSFDKDTPLNLFRLLLSCALLRKADNIPPNLGGDVLRAVLDGRSYPATLFSAALRRCRAEQDVDFARAAILKACLIRNFNREVTVMLDPANNATPYLLGQLFMIYERIQKEAMGDINRTIKDTYWTAAMSEPQRTFVELERKSNQHLKKMLRDSPGRVENLRKMVGDRVGRLYRAPTAEQCHSPFPKSLSAEEQGLFIVGYHHQRQHESTYKTPGAKNNEP